MRTTPTAFTVTDEQCREVRRLRPDTLDTLMVAIHSTDSELRMLARGELARIWNAMEEQ